ncbi:MAG: RIP metalloprotease RseP [Bacteroidales bacterium]|nr:RIP metalloprotease RseP [Bacteroidales bacterium]
MEILIKASQLILSLSILVIFHEFGHFTAAKIFKTRVEKFYLFFNPWFSLLKIKIGETLYGIGWLPLGGYVKISGMIDESMDKEQLKQPPQPWEFRSKPAWQRLIIMLGGVIVNVILAIFIYIFMLFFWGEEYLPTKEVKYGITCDSLALEAGLRNGDKIISIDGEAVEIFREIPAKIILDDVKTIQIIREESEHEINIPPEFIGKLIKTKSVNFIGIRFPFEVEKFSKNSPARDAGIMIDDKIIGINDVNTVFFDEFRNEILEHKGEEISMVIIRDIDTLRKNVSVGENGLVGIHGKSLDNYFTFKKKDYSIVQAFPAGLNKAVKGINNYFKQLRLLFSPEVKAYESVGGFISIADIFPPIWDWHAFWSLTAFLSIMLAILNVLPIPALDGGHVMFLFYEIITRRKPGDKFMEYAQVVGMILLFSLLIFANANDIIKLFD